MKQNMNRLYILLLLCVFTSCLYSQTTLVSSRYQLERVSIGEDIGKEEWYAYYLTDDHHAFQKQISGNHLEKLSADNPNKEKERLAKKHRMIFVKMSIDGNGNLLFVELSSNWLMEEEIDAKHIYNILRQVKNIPINNIRPFQENGYIRYAVVRR